MATLTSLSVVRSKVELDHVIRSVRDLVLVLRFGKENDTTCLHLDNILEKTGPLLCKMCDIHLVEADCVPEYVQYFDVSLVPATLFFFNAQHIKVDWGTVDHTKYVGSFKTKQHFIDVVETIYRGAMRGKMIVNSPLDPRDVPKYDLVYKDI